MSQFTPQHISRRQTGLTLIELMVAMVVGLAVIAAGLAMYTTSGFASRGSNALAQMGEDATLALGIMRNHIAMAGYSKLVKDPTSGVLSRAFAGQPIFGCRYGVDSTTDSNRLTSTDAAKKVITCADVNATASDTLIVMYEADQENTIATSSTPTPKPTDCIGHSALEVAAPPGNPSAGYSVAENRFFINADGALACLGTDAGAEPLVDNVTQMSVWYGVSEQDTTTGQHGTVAKKYLRADQVATANAWDQVVSVRLCLVIKSNNAVLDTAAPYIDCEGNSTATSDKHLYRAFTTTVVLNNRIYQN